jgi:hypothetical protein
LACAPDLPGPRVGGPAADRRLDPRPEVSAQQVGGSGATSTRLHPAGIPAD